MCLLLATVIACNKPSFSPPKHFICSTKPGHPEPGVRVLLLPFKNEVVDLKGAIFEFEYLDRQVDPGHAQTFIRNVPVGSEITRPVPYPGNYRVTIRAAAFKRTSFEILVRREDLVLIEVALEFDPTLKWELEPLRCH